MPEKKNLTRSFAAELRTLPVELVPPDPSGLQAQRKLHTGDSLAEQLPQVQAPRGLVNRLIDRIKKL
jgi:hypothetical protein